MKHTRKRNSSNHTNKKNTQLGGDCGCGMNANPKSMFNFKSMMGGTTDFESNGMPSNTIPLGNSYYNNDPQRMMASGRFLNGGRRRRQRRLGISKKKNKTKKNKTRRKYDSIKKGGGWFSNNIIEYPQTNILSAFGNASGAELNAKMASGMPVDTSTGSGLFSTNGGTKPLV